jgi:hypothetical protein
MTTKRWKNKETGEEQLFTLVGDQWIPAIENEALKIAEQETPGMAFLAGMNANTESLIEGADKLAGTDLFTPQLSQGGVDANKEAYPKAAGAGSMVSELAQIAGPVGLAGKGLKMAGVAKESPVLMATLADILGTAGTAAVRDPGEGSRLENAGSEALWGLLGGGLAKGMAGVTPSALGKEAMDRGDYLTPGYATDNHVLSGVENAMDVIPGFSNATRVLRGEAQQDWRNEVFNTVGRKLGITVDGQTGRESFKQIDDYIRQGYKSAMAEVKDIPRDTFKKVYEVGNQFAAKLSRADQDALQAVSKKIRTFEEKMAKKGANPAAIADQVDYFLRTQAGVAEGPLRKAIMAMKKGFSKSLDPKVAKKLETLDDAFPDLLTLQDAVGKANKGFQDGGFSPDQLMGGSAKTGTPNSLARGESPMFDVATAGGKTVGQKEGGAPLEWFRRLAGVAPSPPGMKTAGNMILGNTALHKEAKQLPDWLLRAASPSRVLPASADEDEDNIIKMLQSLMSPAK